MIDLMISFHAKPAGTTVTLAKIEGGGIVYFSLVHDIDSN